MPIPSEVAGKPDLTCDYKMLPYLPDSIWQAVGCAAHCNGFQQPGSIADYILGIIDICIFFDLTGEWMLPDRLSIMSSTVRCPQCRTGMVFGARAPSGAGEKLDHFKAIKSDEFNVIHFSERALIFPGHGRVSGSLVQNQSHVIPRSFK